MSGRWLDTDIQFKGPIPSDINLTGVEGEQTLLFEPLRVFDRRTGVDLDNNGALIRILKNTEIDISLRTIGNAFFPRVVPVGLTPVVIIEPNRSPRGYTLINPNSSSSGIVTTSTVFPAGTTFPIGDTFSASLPANAFGGASWFLNVTEATAGAIQVDLQSQDPVTGLWFTAQTDLFPGAAALGQYYATTQSLGFDNFNRLRVRVTVDSFDGSIGAVFKPSLSGIVGGASIFLGGPDVNTTIGFPLISGQERTFYLKDNTALYAIAAGATAINIFELQ